ncbi:MAG: hypothetical protein E4H07_07375 [Nitrosomonadales bacterium]|nr:MAG: hypothetical protein E4H07_07375 [Nitrosomonadales bacterium]
MQPSKWREKSLISDCIAASLIYKGTFIMGNGGFSYRSSKLINAIAKVKNSESVTGADLPEDILI